MKHLVVFYILIFGFVGQIIAQPSDSTSRSYRQGVGINLGGLTGFGLAYRYWWNRFGVQGAFFPLKYRHQINLNAGLTVLFSLSRTVLSPHFRPYLYWGNNMNINALRAHGRVGALNWFDTTYNTGLGAGMSVGNDVAFNLSIGYGVFNLFSEENSIKVQPSIEAGLFVRF